MNDRNRQLLAEYTQFLEMKNYKPRGIEEKERTARYFLEYVQEYNVSLNTMTLTEAEEYCSYLRLATDNTGKTRYCSQRINGMISELRLFYKFLTGCGRAYSNPFDYVEKVKGSQLLPKAIITIEQMGILLDSIKVSDKKTFTLKVILELLYATGMRINEVEKLTLPDIKLTEGYILIRDDKERQDRKAVLPEYIGHLLNIYLQIIYIPENRYLFKTGQDRTLNKWVNYHIKKLSKKSGFHHIGCHGFRHSIASHLLKNGADLREVQEFLGHRRIKNTEIYTRLSVEDLQHVVNSCHPREQKEA